MKGGSTAVVVLVMGAFYVGSGAPAHAAAAVRASVAGSAPAVAPAPPAPPPVVAGEMTPTSWALALLADLGMPATPENLRALVAWERAEGGHWANTARYNPLNTTEQEPGSYPINPVGVQAYTSWGEGLQATVATLRNGLYGGILAALRDGRCAPCVAAAVAASPWGTGRFEV